jgi:hypothetical protein
MNKDVTKLVDDLHEELVRVKYGTHLGTIFLDIDQMIDRIYEIKRKLYDQKYE